MDPNASMPKTEESPNENGELCHTEQPTTSKQDSMNPEHNSYNVNDLKALDFNSADDVRVAMRGIISENIPQRAAVEADIQILRHGSNSSVISHIETIEAPKRNSSPINKRHGKSESVSTSGRVVKKKSGRPPKAGSSKKIRRASVTDLYLGKLSNVVDIVIMKYNIKRLRRR